MAKPFASFVTTAAREAYVVASGDLAQLAYDCEASAYYRAVATGAGAASWAQEGALDTDAITNASTGAGDTLTEVLDDLEARLAALE